MTPIPFTNSLTGALLIRAFRTYQALAYPKGDIPANRRHFADLPDDRSLTDILSLSGVESPKTTGGPAASCYRFRLGCEWYPHMKILVNFVGPQGEPIFSVDTHDQLPVPADSPDAAPFRALQARNLELATRIQDAWTQNGIPTQVSQLKQYLEEHRAKR